MNTIRKDPPRTPTVHLVSLGCPKNQVDAETALGGFAAAGFRHTARPGRADVLVVNTCAFIAPAEQEAVDALLAAADLKRRGRVRVVLAAGCLVSRYGPRRLKHLIPELDGAYPPSAHAHLPELALTLLRRAAPSRLAGPRVLLSGPGSAYLKIAEGCSRRCAYCLIPRLRGPLRSRPLEGLLAEAADLARRGAGELVLVAQDLTEYGTDLHPARTLGALLDRLVRLPRVRWVRLMYANPDGVDEGLVRRLAAEPKLCRYLDLPVQHAAPAVLRRMGRPGSGEAFLRLIARLRRRVPDLTLRTTLLTGFPGEGPAEHAALLEFVRRARFDRLGVFAFSREAGTPAAKFAGQVPEGVRAERRRELLALQSGISRERLGRWVGRVVDCLVEEPSGPRHVLARTAADAPEVDGGIVLSGQARPGSFVRARVTGATDHDLSGVLR